MTSEVEILHADDTVQTTAQENVPPDRWISARNKLKAKK